MTQPRTTHRQVCLDRRPAGRGIERLPPGRHADWHYRTEAYATIVLEGGFIQCGYTGRIRAEAGDVVIQRALDAHSNLMISRGVDLLRLPFDADFGSDGKHSGVDVEPIVELARRNSAEAIQMLRTELRGSRPDNAIDLDWTDELARDLKSDVNLRLTDWAEHRGLRRETVARGFAATFGIPPSQYRLELRAHAAWFRVRDGFEALADIALDLGYADQSHMTRQLSWFAGMSPSRCRSIRGIEPRKGRADVPVDRDGRHPVIGAG